jgi:trans-2-enoyl-CoA reductase
MNENLLPIEQYHINSKNFLSVLLFEVEKVEYFLQENVNNNLNKFEKIRVNVSII